MTSSFVTSFDTPRTSWGPGSRSLASPTTAFDSVNGAPAEALLRIVSSLLPLLSGLSSDRTSIHSASGQPPPKAQAAISCAPAARTRSMGLRLGAQC